MDDIGYSFNRNNILRRKPFLIVVLDKYLDIKMFNLGIAF